MKYPSVHDSESWIAFTVAKDRPLWSAEKFLRGESVGLTSGPPGDPFFVHLALNPIPEDEKHLYRDWPSEEILAIYRELRPEEEAGAEDGIWDLREFCRSILDSVQKTEGWGRAEAASILCEMLKKEVEPAAT